MPLTVSPQHGEALGDVAHTSMPAMMMWIAPLEEDQDRATHKTLGAAKANKCATGCRAPHSDGTCCIGLAGGNTDAGSLDVKQRKGETTEQDVEEEETRHRAGAADVDEDASKCGALNGSRPYRVRVDGVKSTKGGERHEPDGSIHCYVEAKAGGSNDEAERRDVDGIYSPCARAKGTKGCAAGRHAPGGYIHCCIELE